MSPVTGRLFTASEVSAPCAGSTDPLAAEPPPLLPRPSSRSLHGHQKYQPIHHTVSTTHIYLMKITGKHSVLTHGACEGHTHTHTRAGSFPECCRGCKSHRALYSATNGRLYITGLIPHWLTEQTEDEVKLREKHTDLFIASLPNHLLSDAKATPLHL